MKEIEELVSLNQIEDFLKIHLLSFLYISRENCSVCHALLPQLREMLEGFPEIHLGHIHAEDVEEIAGYFSIFTVPTLLLFVEGKEYIRVARFVHLDLLKEKIEKIYNMYAAS